MRHVDEGTIHAWLDEQITDPVEAARIDEHLRECGECRARLADEQASFEQAQTLLAGAAPSGERPSFEALVALSAGTPGRHSSQAGRIAEPETASGRQSTRGHRERMWIQLGWAASLALAVGLGWTARELTDRETSTPEPALVVADRSATENVAAPAGRPVASQPVEPRTSAVTAPPPPTPRQQSARAANAIPRPREPQPQDAPAAPAPESISPAALAETVTVQTAPPAAVAAPPPAVAPPRQELAIVGDSAPLAAVAADTQWQPVPRTEAAARTGMPLYGIDGLEPQYTSMSADGAVVRTLYRLTTGELVELVQQRATPASEPTVAEVQATRRAFAETGRSTVAAGRGGAAVERVASVPRTWSDVRGGVRITLQTTSEAADLNGLGTRLRVD